MVQVTSKNLFEACRLNRYQSALQLARQQAKPMLAVLGVLDHVRLDQAEKYVLDRSTSSGIQRQLLDGKTLFPTLPPLPIWLQLRDPQPLDHWSEAQFAALYFYSPLIPRALRNIRKGLRLPGRPSTIWRLDLINPGGDLLLAYQFEAEHRTWKIMSGHRCEWNQCVEAISGERKIIVNPCQQCESEMDYCVRWLIAGLLMVANCKGKHCSPLEEEVDLVLRQQKRDWCRRTKQVPIELRYTVLHAPECSF